VSLLERLGRGHLDESQLARLWATGEIHPHLSACESCRIRFDELDRWVTDIGAELQAEADTALTPDRLAVQQAQIARRLEALERPGRVIAFPKAARAVISGHSHVRRWITVAAAAGLVAGIGLGQMLDLHRSLETSRVASAPQLVTTGARADTVRPAVLTTNDLEILSDSDAFARPRVAALVPLEDLTPHARDLTERLK
jgi:predicted anti-sigma-YlaC factor YlaD